MRQLLSLLAVITTGIHFTHAAIPVGADGSATHSFTIRPPANEWATRSIPGVDTSFSTASELLNAIQTNASATITNQLLDGAGANPPGQNTVAAWTAGGTASLWTRPTGNAATLLMATLENTSGIDQSILRIVYTLAQSGFTPAEQAPAHEVYYSLSGAPGTWLNIPALSGGNAGLKSNTVALAQTWASGAPLYVLWVDDNTPGGVDRGYSIDNISFAGNTRPTVASIPNVIADVMRLIRVPVIAMDVEGSPFTIALDPGAPATARFNTTNGVFLWQPARTDAGTTNLVTFRATEAGNTAFSSTQSFTLIVRDYIELSIGSVVAVAGQSTNVTIECVSTAPLTNLTFAVELSTDRLSGLFVDNLVPALASSSQDLSQPGRALFTFNALPGQVLFGTQRLARLNFIVAAGQSSAFIPLKPSEVAGLRAVEGLAPSVLLNDGRVVAVSGQPLLEASGKGDTRTVALYGKPGTNYLLETSINAGISWQPWQSVLLSNLIQSVDASTHTNTPVIFYRAREGVTASAAQLSPAPTELKTAVKLKSRRITAALKRQKRIGARVSSPSPLLLP